MKKKPKDLRVVRVNFKKSKKESNLPKMPRGLSPDSKKVWKQLLRKIDHSILLPCDGFALMLLSDALGGREKLKRELIDQSNRKEFSELLKLQNDMVIVGLNQFFLSPAARNIEKD
jgi:hypothetical protein